MKALLRLGVIAALLAPGCSHAADTETIAEEVAFQAVHLVDTGQTVWMSSHEDRFYERSNVLDGGWIIGARPSQARVWQYMAGEALAHALFTAVLVHYHAPRWSIRVWEAVTIAVDADTIAHNASIGVRFHL